MKQFNQDNPLHVLVTAAGGPAGINVLRLLSAFPEVKLFAADTDPNVAGRHFTQDFAVMAPFRDATGYKQSILELVRGWNINVVIPTLDEELVVIQQILEGTNATVLSSPIDTLDITMHKKKFYAWMEKNFPDYIAKWQTFDIPLEWDAPQYFVKPNRGRGSSGCALMTRSEVEAFAKQQKNPSEWIVMDVLPFVEWTVDAYVGKDGVPAFVLPRERLMVVSGISMKGHSVKNEIIIKRTKEIIAKLPFWGPICVQWKADADGDPKVTEINARMSGGAMITALSGANAMECMVKELRGEPLGEVKWEERTVIGYTEYKAL